MGPIILFEGTFDPPHISHKKILLEALKQLKGLAVVMVATDESARVCSRKTKVTPYKIRQDMCFGFLGLIKNVIVPEVDDELRYTIDNVNFLYNVFNLKDKSELYLLMGGDWEDKLKTFHDANKLRELATPFIYPRYDNISSSNIRESIKENKIITKLVSPGVAGVIKMYNLYK